MFLAWGSPGVPFATFRQKRRVTLHSAGARNVIAVTGACLITRRKALSYLGGFDETTGAPDIGLDYVRACMSEGMFSVICLEASRPSRS